MIILYYITWTINVSRVTKQTITTTTSHDWMATWTWSWKLAFFQSFKTSWSLDQPDHFVDCNNTWLRKKWRPSKQNPTTTTVMFLKINNNQVEYVTDNTTQVGTCEHLNTRPTRHAVTARQCVKGSESNGKK